MLGDLQRGGAGELVRLAGDEAVERERRVEARCLRSLRRHRREVQAPTRRRRRRRRGGFAGRRLGRATGVAGRGDGELDAEVVAGGVPEHGRDPGPEAVLHPLQDEAVRRHQPNPVRGRLAAQRTNPGRELLRRQVPLEGGEAGRPRIGAVRRGGSPVFQGSDRAAFDGAALFFWWRAKKGTGTPATGIPAPSYAHSRGRTSGYPQAVARPARAFAFVANPFERRESDRSHRRSRDTLGRARLTESPARCSNERLFRGIHGAPFD